ncbi:MAG: sigma-70 family RNA polymerase sigma factor [Pseudomonadales bacterium]|nr:sigma-70 family RNA polymerase sigma factor [Pseudomonadales bacterium]
MSGTHPEEQALIDGMLARDDEAFRQAIIHYQGSMLYLARSLVGEKLADEVVQEAWFSVLQAIDRFEGRAALKTWILRIVANEAKSRLRRENRMTSLESLLATDEGLESRFDDRGHWNQPLTDWHEDSPEGLLSGAQLESCLQMAIAALPDMQAATLTLKEHQGYSPADICNILELSESNVRVLLHRARTRLYQTIEHFQNTGECCT